MGAEKQDRLLVLYASQTGTAADAAERVGREAERGGCPSVDVLSMDTFDPVSQLLLLFHSSMIISFSKFQSLVVFDKLIV